MTQATTSKRTADSRQVDVWKILLRRHVMEMDPDLYSITFPYRFPVLSIRCLMSKEFRGTSLSRRFCSSSYHRKHLSRFILSSIHPNTSRHMTHSIAHPQYQHMDLTVIGISPLKTNHTQHHSFSQHAQSHTDHIPIICNTHPAWLMFIIFH